MDRRYVRPGVVVLAAVVLAGLFVGGQALAPVHDIACTRDACTIRTRTLLWSQGAQTIPLADITAFEYGAVSSYSSGSRTTTTETFVTVRLRGGDTIRVDDDDFFESVTHWLRDDVDRLEAFRTQPQSPATIDVAIGHAYPALFYGLVGWLFAIPIAQYFAVARVTIAARPGERAVIVTTRNGVLDAVGRTDQRIPAGVRLEPDPARRRLYTRDRDQPRRDVTLPRLSARQFAEVVAALEQEMSRCS